MLPVLEAVLDGRQPPVLPVPGADPQQAENLMSALRVGEEIGDDVALVVPTSGTTGTPKGAMLSAPALIASASATHDRLGGTGTWLLALPTYHIAGLQVLIRSTLAGTVPAELDTSYGFDPSGLPEAVAAMGAGRRYASMVAAQLAAALTDPAATAALAELDAILLGGGPPPAPVLEGTAAQGIRIVRTYGMSETAGGCVYDGVPLDGAGVRIDGDGGPGRITLGGPMVANGYRNPQHPDPFAEPGWFVTDDVGALDDSGALRVLGRIDDAISTGGLTVLPQPVEAAVADHPAVADCAVFGIPDDRLGQRVVVAVVLHTDAPGLSLDELRDHVGRTLPRAAAPRELHVIAELPRHGIGKVNRRALIDRFS